MNTATRVRAPFNGYMTDVTEATSVASALAAADLDFHVHKALLYALTPSIDGVDQIEIEGKAGILRNTDSGYRSLGVASWSYGVIQNDEAFAPIDYLMAEGVISRIVQAGSVGHGKRVFMLAELASECRLSDPHQRMIMFATTHDGTGSFTVRGWLNRMHCTNQIPGIFGRKKQQWIAKVNHTSNASTYIAGVRGAVLAAVKSLDVYDELITRLQSVQVDASREREYVDALYPMRPELLAPYSMLDAGQRRARGVIMEKRSKTLDLINGPHNEGLHGTAAALFHGAVEYSDYFSRGDNAARILNGTDVPFKLKALELAGQA